MSKKVKGSGFKPGSGKVQHLDLDSVPEIRAIEDPAVASPVSTRKQQRPVFSTKPDSKGTNRNGAPSSVSSSSSSRFSFAPHHEPPKMKQSGTNNTQTSTPSSWREPQSTKREKQTPKALRAKERQEEEEIMEIDLNESDSEREEGRVHLMDKGEGEGEEGDGQEEEEEEHEAGEGEEQQTGDHNNVSDDEEKGESDGENIQETQRDADMTGEAEEGKTEEDANVGKEGEQKTEGTEEGAESKAKKGLSPSCLSRSSLCVCASFSLLLPQSLSLCLSQEG